MKKIICIALISLMATIILKAQVSPYLEKGESGFGINAGVETGRGFDGLFGYASYSLKGVVDFVARLDQGYYNEDLEILTNPDATSLYYSGEVTWWVLRESPTTGIDVNFGAIASIEGEKNQDFTFIGGSYEGYLGWVAGIHTNVNFSLPNQWSLQPKLLFYYGMGKDRYNYIISSGSETYRYASSYFGASLSKKMVGGNSLVTTFMQGMSSSSNHYYEFSIGYVFSFKK